MPIKLSCPQVIVCNNTDTYLPIYNIKTEIEIHVSCAFIYLRISFLNNTNKKIDGIFQYPTQSNGFM